MSDYNEQVLEDDYPVYMMYVYLVNGKPKQSLVTGTVRTLKNDLIKHEGYDDTIEIKSCDLSGRGLM